MNKKGVTLVEIIAVIALIAIVMIIVTPNLMKILSDSNDKTMSIQEKELAEAGLLYLEDHCKNPIGDLKCPNKIYDYIYRNDDYTYSGRLNLGTLVDEKYIETIEFDGQSCIGCVRFMNNKAYGYLKCGDRYQSKNYDRCIIPG